MMNYVGIGVLAAFAAASAPGLSQAAPQGMLNKTVTVSFEISVPARTPDGQSRAARRSVNKVIYVSSAGRLFSRTARRASRGGDTVEVSPGESASAASVQGNTIVGTVPYFTGARRLVVSFDSSFSNCTATVVVGRENGRMVWKSLSGEVYTATGPTSVSTPTCSVQSGNPFAGE